MRRKQTQWAAGREDFLPSNTPDLPRNLRLLPLDQYKPGDSFYTQKTVNGHSETYLCAFQSFGRGLVVGRILRRSEFAEREQGSLLTSKPSTCFLIGFAEGERWPRYHWFGETIPVKSPPARGFLGRVRRRHAR